jgi:hypothetical protein
MQRFKKSKFNKVAGMLLAVAFLFTGSFGASLVQQPAVALADDPIELTAGTVTGNPGDTVEVPITLTSSGKVAGGQYDLSIDLSLLTYKQTVAGDDISTSFRMLSNQLESGDIRVMHLRLARANRIPAGTVVIAVMQFEVAAGASPGAACALELTGVKYHDGDRIVLPVTANNGQFSVPETPPALASDTTDNTVGQAVEITFTDNEAWRSAISGVKVNGTALPAEQYTISAGKISIAAPESKLLKPDPTEKEKCDSTGPRMRTDYGAHAVDHHPAVEVGEFFLYQVGQLACILIACRIGDKALARVFSAILRMHFHLMQNLVDDTFFAANLCARDEFSVIAHITQRAYVQQSPHKRRCS